MTIFEKLSTLAEITDQDEMIKACKIIPDEELRLALVVLALAYNKNEQANREIFQMTLRSSPQKGSDTAWRSARIWQ